MRHDDVFERVEPPPGGLTRLRARLDRRTRRNRWWLAVPAALAVGGAVLAVVGRPAARALPVDAFSQATLGLSRPEPGATLLETSAPLAELSPPGANVVVLVVVDGR